MSISGCKTDESSGQRRSTHSASIWYLLEIRILSFGVRDEPDLILHTVLLMTMLFTLIDPYFPTSFSTYSSTSCLYGVEGDKSEPDAAHGVVGDHAGIVGGN